MSSHFSKDFKQWQQEYHLLSTGDVHDLLDLGDARKAVWAWAVALIAGAYETGNTRTWDNYFQNLGVK